MDPIYRRHAVPPSSRTRLRWWVLLWFALIFSPFIGFTLEGNVSEAGLAKGMPFALVAIAGLVALGLKDARALRRLPEDVRAQWREGRLVPADGAPRVCPPARFAANRDFIEMVPEGVVIARRTLLTMHGVADRMRKIWVSEQVGQLFVPWRDIEEWVVDTALEGEDPYTLQLKTGGAYTLRRFQPDGAGEADLLDAVRSIGKVPVRMRTDL